MRTSSTERILLLVAAAFVLFAFGYFYGRNSGLREVTVQTEAVSAVQPDLPVRELPLLPQETAAERVNLNTADAAQLQSLPGIGPVLAQRILEYRETYGNFTQIEEITRVSGIGEGILGQIFDYITVG